MRDEYADKVANAASDGEFYDLMREMVNLLGDEHSRFLSPAAVALQSAVYEDLQVPGGIGAYLSELDGELVLGQVYPGKPAFEAGLRPGERIVAVDGVAWQQFSGASDVILAIVGEAGTEVVLTVRSVDGADRQVSITRAVVELGDVLVRGRRVEGTDVGLLTIDGFDSPKIPGMVRETLGDLVSHGALEGLIVDVRANPGGADEAFLGTLALFVDGGSVGSRVSRDEAFELLIPQGETIPELVGLPLAVLTGPLTTSAGECFAAGMQLHGRATLVGLPTAGNTESVFSHLLSDGSVVAVAERIYQLPDGSLIEGVGVQPDVRVDLDWHLYGTDDDPQIQAAMGVLSSE